MATLGHYLYGFTDRTFRPGADLRGLADAPVSVIAFGDVAAVVSPHPVQPLMPSRRNVEPHHRVVRRVSSEATLVPAAFGHITATEREILGVIQGNHEDIRGELARLEGKCEMGLKISWSVDNIFGFLVRTNAELRSVRDRVFSRPSPSMKDKLQVGSTFEAVLTRERERLTNAALGALSGVTCDVIPSPPRDEKNICNVALLVERARALDFDQALRRAAQLFDANYTFEYSGPWPPYSFVRLRLQAPAETAA